MELTADRNHRLDQVLEGPDSQVIRRPRTSGAVPGYSNLLAVELEFVLRHSGKRFTTLISLFLVKPVDWSAPWLFGSLFIRPSR
jgi:hypothetical protein